ncbi:hypothetical protein A4G29_02555 [Mycobacterium kansasii]|nr:hypothetical protein A4G29_02555 [Mycobacterium kansasii]
MDDEDDEKGDDEVAVLADGPKARIGERALELSDDLGECPLFIRRAAAWCGTSNPIVETTSDSLLVMI